MSRLMSVSMTVDAVIERRKTVTRRKGWWLDKNGRRLLHEGDHLTLCRKVQGRKPGEPLERLAEVEVVGVRRERLGELLTHYALIQQPGYGEGEVAREGFPGADPVDFVQRLFIDAQGIHPDDDVTRIEWRYLVCDDCGYGSACSPGPLETTGGVTRCYVCQHEYECTDEACAWCEPASYAAERQVVTS